MFDAATTIYLPSVDFTSSTSWTIQAPGTTPQDHHSKTNSKGLKNSDNTCIVSFFGFVLDKWYKVKTTGARVTSGHQHNFSGEVLQTTLRRLKFSLALGVRHFLPHSSFRIAQLYFHFYTLVGFGFWLTFPVMPTCCSAYSACRPLDPQVCMDNEVNCTLVPCGHHCTCINCAAEFQQCPVCRTNVDQKINTYGA